MNREIYKPGTRIYYSGDMANMPSAGTITAYHPRDRYSLESVDIQYDESRFVGDARLSRKVPLLAFAPGPGCRFELLAEWKANRKAALAKFIESAKNEQACPATK